MVQPTNRGTVEFYLYGRRPVLEALHGGKEIAKVYVRYGAHGKEIQMIQSLARARQIPCMIMAKQKFDQLERKLHRYGKKVNTQGVIALRQLPMRFLRLGELFDQSYQQTETPIFVALDRIEDPQNLGAIFRICDAAAVHGILLPQKGSAPLTPVVWKASAGAVEFLPITQVNDLAEALEDCRYAGFQIVGTSGSAAIPYTEADFRSPTVFVFGNEGKGIQPKVLAKCDLVVTIPMLGNVASLNVAATVAIVLFETLRQRSALQQEKSG